MVINSNIQSEIYKFSNGDSYEIIPRVYMPNTGMYYTLISKNNRVGIKIKKNSNSKDYDLDIGFRGIYTPKQVISIIQTPISWKDRYWVIWMLEGYSGIYPKEVEVFLNRDNI